MRLDVVLHARDAARRRCGECRGGRRRRAARNSDRRLRPDGDDDVPVVARGAHPDEEALVGLLVDEHVLLDRRCRARGATPGRAARRRRPACRRGAGRRATTRASPPVARTASSSVSPVAMLPHPHVVALVAREVDGIGQQVAGGRHLGGSRPRRSRGPTASAFWSRSTSSPAGGRPSDSAGRCGWSASVHPPLDGVLLTLDRPGVVPPAVVAHRHREVGLLDPGAELLEDLLGQWLQVLGAARSAWAFSAASSSSSSCDVAVGHPRVGVLEAVAVVDAGDRGATSDRGLLHARSLGTPIGATGHDEPRSPRTPGPLPVTVLVVWQVSCGSRPAPAPAARRCRRRAQPPAAARRGAACRPCRRRRRHRVGVAGGAVDRRGPREAGGVTPDDEEVERGARQGERGALAAEAEAELAGRVRGAGL